MVADQLVKGGAFLELLDEVKVVVGLEALLVRTHKF